jgi:hypothetical protein
MWKRSQLILGYYNEICLRDGKTMKIRIIIRAQVKILRGHPPNTSQKHSLLGPTQTYSIVK